MTTPLLTWICIVVLMAIVFAASIVSAAVHSGALRHIFSLGTEREELFVPGDRSDNDSYVYNDDDDF